MCCVDRLNPQAKAAVQGQSTLTLFVRSDLSYYKSLNQRDMQMLWLINAFSRLQGSLSSEY